MLYELMRTLYLKWEPYQYKLLSLWKKKTPKNTSKSKSGATGSTIFWGIKLRLFGNLVDVDSIKNLNQPMNQKVIPITPFYEGLGSPHKDGSHFYCNKDVWGLKL